MVFYLYILPLVLIALIAGLVIHSFIIAINVSDWWKGRSVTPVNQVITFLGVTRMCAQCVVSSYLFVARLILKNLHLRTALFVINVVYTFFTYANIWLTSLLSIVFCLKISNLRIRLFLNLRRMIEQRTAYFIVASGLLSFLNSWLPLLTAFNEVTNGGTRNVTMDNLLMGCTFINLLYSQLIAAFIPLLFFCISSVLLFTSLYHHIWKMWMSRILSINLKTYYSAMKFVFMTFIYNTIYINVHFVCEFYYYMYCMDLLQPYVLLGSLPTLHSFYLIYRTVKLRSQISKVLQNVIDFLFQRKDSETKEEIDIVAQ